MTRDIDTSNPPFAESKEVAVAETALRRTRIDQRRPRYKWVALSNTTLGGLLASINASIVLISLPAIFRGIGLNPLAPGNVSYLLWMLMGYLVVTAVLVVPLGRLGDIFGRVRIYNLGFAIFTVAAIALSFDPFHLGGGAVWLICWRVIQGIGGAMLMACSAAILTDAFPSRQRGMALGVNQVAAIAGQFLGLLMGGLLSEWDWRAVFWVGVPLGVGGTVGSFRSLREVGVRTPARLDSAFRRGLDRVVGSNHLRDPALRRSSNRLDQPVGAGFDRAGRCRTGRAVLCRIARTRSHARHQAVPVQALRAGQPCRADGLRRAWRPAVHADHLAAGHLATTARLQLRIQPALVGHLHAADDHRLPAGRPAVGHAIGPLRLPAVRGADLPQRPGRRHVHGAQHRGDHVQRAGRRARRRLGYPCDVHQRRHVVIDRHFLLADDRRPSPVAARYAQRRPAAARGTRDGGPQRGQPASG